MKSFLYNQLIRSLLRLMAFLFNRRPSLNRYLRSTDGYLNFCVGFTTRNGDINAGIKFHEGHVSVQSRLPADADVIMKFKDETALREMLRSTPNEVLNMMLKNRLVTEGNLTWLQVFNFYLSLLLGKIHQRRLDKLQKLDRESRENEYEKRAPEVYEEFMRRKNYRIKIGGADKKDPGVVGLEDPYLSDYSLENFPRLATFLDEHLNIKAEVCPERPALLTAWHRENGFEQKQDGSAWSPGLRQGLAFKHLMQNKKPLVAKNALLAGSTTAANHTGVVVYPDAQGAMIWGELLTAENRLLNPYVISEETRELLHSEVFPYWINRNFRELVRAKHKNPLSLEIDERWVAYFVWKSVGISHTIPDFPTLLSKGTEGLKNDILDRIATVDENTKGEKGEGLKEQINVLEGMIHSLEGLEAYADHLAREAEEQSHDEPDPIRRTELRGIARACARVPRKPARSLQEALQAMWIGWVGIHMENTNTGLSLGRLDTWLQPYFENDLAGLGDAEARARYIENAIELCGDFFMRCTDHLPLAPDIGNYLFGGSSSDQAITLGGTTREGKDAVCDMTYILLKVTEMLCIRDPNVNARYHLEVNSETYLKRLCEVNFITAATPSMHNDETVFASLAGKGYAIEDIRDWSATGCVEPTLSGKHMGHTGSILMNMVAALEMALNNGRHPLMDRRLGPESGDIARGDFSTFDEFFEAYVTQQTFLIEQAMELNNNLAEIHAEYRPTPLLSSLIDGCVEKGLDVTRGGARYNSSGTSNIGLSDIVDSLLVVKKLVFKEKRFSFEELKEAITADFKNDPALHAQIQSRVELFGSGNPEALELANRIIAMMHKIYSGNKNYRGGPYTAGFWSMSQHVAYGNLSGTLPSGRLAGKAFTPGLTPHPSASPNFLDNIRDVAGLDYEKMDNNIAFNVKLTPSAEDSREKTVDTMGAYVNSYCKLGGMQMQFNVLTSDVLKDAMVNPDNYKNLLVRISGYNAYFVTLNKQMQIELIERAEYGVTPSPSPKKQGEPA